MKLTVHDTNVGNYKNAIDFKVSEGFTLSKRENNRTANRLIRMTGSEGC